MKFLKGIKQYILDNKLYCFSMLIGLVLFAIQMKYVVLYADDLALGVISKKCNFNETLEYFKNNYMTWGGGPTPIIAIFFMKFPIRVWKIFNCIIVFGIVYMSVNLASYKMKVNKGFVAILIWSFIYFLNIWVSRETLYWMDGNLAYVFTTFQLLLYIYVTFNKFIVKKRICKIDYIILPIIAFLAGWTGPQVAVVTVAYSVMIMAWIKLVKKEKIPKFLFFVSVFAIAGCLVEVLAPGNAERMRVGFPEFAQYSFFEKILYRCDSVYGIMFTSDLNVGSLSFYLFLVFGLSSIIAMNLSKDERNKKIKTIIKFVSTTVIFFLMFMAFIRLGIMGDELTKYLVLENLHYNGICIRNILPYLLYTYILIASCILVIYISVIKKNWMVAIIYIMALMTQGAMIMSPYSPNRSTFFSIALSWIVISNIIIYAKNDNVEIMPIVILVFGTTRRELLTGAIIIYYIIRAVFNMESKDIKALTIVFMIFAGFNWFVVTKNYKENQEVYFENMSRIERFKENGKEEKVLVLKEPVNIYGFSKFVGVEWIETSVKEYFEIPQDVMLLEEKN